MLLFEELTLHNFGPYLGRQRMVLAPPSPDRPIILVGGLNGVGKTSLLDALQLVLYGKLANCASRPGLPYEDFLIRCVNRAVPPKDGAALELVLRADVDGVSTSLTVRRGWYVRGKSLKETFTVHRDGTLDPVLTESWDDYVDELLPNVVSPLFFFDGEKIEALADPARAGAVIATAVDSLLGLHLVDQLARDLVVLERRKKATKASDEQQEVIDHLQEQLDLAEQRRQDALHRRAQAQTELSRCDKTLRTAEAAYKLAGGELYERRTDIEADQREQIARISATEEALQVQAAGPLPFLLVADMLSAISEQATAEAESREAAVVLAVLKKRDRRVVEKLKQTWEGGVIEELQSVLAAERAKQQQTADHEVYLNADATLAAHTDVLLSTQLPELKAAAERLLSRLAAERSSLDDADRRLAGVPSVDTIADLAIERDTAQAERASAIARITSIDESLEQLTRERDNEEKKLSRALDGLASQEIERSERDRIIEHAERVRATLSEFRNRLLERHSGRIETEVLNCFQKLLRKEGLVRGLRIDRTTFEISLQGKHARAIPIERLSAGERQLLAVALLWGLARSAKWSVPTIIDTPLGRLDSQHRAHLVERYFPKASHQVLLLSTDEEIDEGLAEQLRTHVGRSYRLDFDDASQGTTIVEGYFWDAQESVDVA